VSESRIAPKKFMENVNERTIRLTGGAFIEEDLQLDCDYILKAPITVYSSGEKRSNNDGTYNCNYRAKITGAVELESKGHTIHGKKKGSQSALLRSLIMGKAIEMGQDGDAYYSVIINKIINNLDFVIEILKNK
jgi:hypothetical protein